MPVEEYCPRHMQNSTFITQILAKPEPAHTRGYHMGSKGELLQEL